MGTKDGGKKPNPNDLNSFKGFFYYMIIILVISCDIYPISGNIESQWNLWKFLKCYIFFRNYHFSFWLAEFAGFQTFFIVLLDKQSFSYYDTHNQTRKTVEKEEYIFDRVFTESCRRWDCSIALEMEWTFEGSPEF